jgi:hypothetical protein
MKNYVTLIAIVAAMVISLSILSYLKLKTKYNQQKLLSEKLQTDYSGKFNEVNNLKDTIYNLKDSIMSLNTQKGFVELQLNQSESVINSITNNAKKIRKNLIIDSTPIEYRSNCDSAINLLNIYESQNLEYRSLVDSIEIFGHRKDIIYDSTFKFYNSLANDFYEKLLHLRTDTARLHNDIKQQIALTKKEKRKGNKKLLIGSGVGSLVTIILLLF